ncbi:TRI47 protein, partial [Polypterus senegalus]
MNVTAKVRKPFNKVNTLSSNRHTADSRAQEVIKGLDLGFYQDPRKSRHSDSCLSLSSAHIRASIDSVVIKASSAKSRSLNPSSPTDSPQPLDLMTLPNTQSMQALNRVGAEHTPDKPQNQLGKTQRLTMAETQLCGLQDEFTCSVCLDTLTDPVIFPCGHNFCLKCLTDCWDQSQECSCPHCARPELNRNTLLNEVMKKMKRPRLSPHPSQNYAGSGEVECDFCTGKKLRAVKSCLTCMASYCQTHLQPHYEVAVLKHHKLVDSDGNLKEKLCGKHWKSLELFCRTEETCICMMCGITEHNSHEKVELETEREGKQKHLGATQSEIRKRLEEKEKKLKETRRTVAEMKISVKQKMEEHDKSFTDLIQCIEEAHKKLTEKFREQEKRNVEKAKKVMEQLEKEIKELKRKDSELNKLSEMKDHVHFLQKQLGATLSDIKRTLEGREKTLKETRRTMEEMKMSVERDMEKNEKSFTALIRSIEKAQRKLTERIKEQEKREIEKAEGVMEQLEKEIEELKRREAELKEFSVTKDHIHFLQTFSSRCVLPADGNSLSSTVTADFSSEDLRKELSCLTKSVEKISQWNIMTWTPSAIRRDGYFSHLPKGSSSYSDSLQSRPSVHLCSPEPQPWSSKEVALSPMGTNEEELGVQNTKESCNSEKCPLEGSEPSYLLEIEA